MFEQAVNDERLDETHRILINTCRIGDIDVEGTNFHVLDAAAPERRGRPLAGLSDALRPDRAVILVLDLQLVGVQLLVLAIPDNSDLFVGGFGRPDGLAEIMNVFIQPVQGNGNPGLRLVVVTQITHAQGGSEGFVVRLRV